MLTAILSSPWYLQQARLGLFGDYIDGLASHLLAQGYRRDSRRHKLHLVVAFGHWLQAHRHRLVALDEAKVDLFLRARRRHRTVQRGDLTLLHWWLEHLRSGGHIPLRPNPTPSALDRALLAYTDYLQRERGLAQRTVGQYQGYIREFLVSRFRHSSIRFNALSQADTHGYLQRKSQVVCPNALHGVVAALRSYLTFLRLHGKLQTDLASGIPAVACWRLSTVPKYLKPAEVEQLLNSCNQGTVRGQRDYTVLLLLARLGLRAGELVAMRLDDLHWDSGEMLVRGKGQRYDRLPIPEDVGTALATYLRDGRPPCQTRHVFVRICAPHREFGGSYAISAIVQQAIDRIGLHPPRKGAHVLRHSLATHMLQKGATLTEIGEVLRHRNPITTELYSKVDLNALHALAQPWPEEGV